MPENAARNLVALRQALHTGRLLEDYELHKPKFGSVKIEGFAKEFAQIFKNGKDFFLIRTKSKAPLHIKNYQ